MQLLKTRRQQDPVDGRRTGALGPKGRSMKTLLMTVITSIGLAVIGILVIRGRAPSAVQAWSSGPTIEHLESLSELVCLRVHVSDVLVGENDQYRGSWLIKGDAVLAIDLRQAKIVECDKTTRRARLRLPPPKVTSPRVDHKRTRTWSVEKTRWITWTGNPDKLRDEAMWQAQRVIQAASGSADNIQLAKNSAERLILEMYRMVGWELLVEWVEIQKR
jgi:hypothetical protein